MNELERRTLEVAQNHQDLKRLVASLKRTAVIEHFGYTATLGSVAAPLVNAVPQSVNLPLQADAYFLLQYVSTAVIKPNTPWYCTDAGNILLQITDTGSGEVLFNTPSLAGILTGTTVRPQTGVPLLLPIPRLIKPNTTVKIDVTQLGVNVTDNQQPVGFFISLLGSRIANY